MNRLSTYVSAIRGKESATSILRNTTDKSCWQDQGFEVRQEVSIYTFDNGVVIRRTVEQDDFPSETACGECWITYEVMSNGDAGIDIRPAHQSFENTCRESFWLAYHTAQ